jgi:hypothetical protein
MKKGPTAGELALRASQDTTNYDPRDVGYVLCDDVAPELRKCIEAHRHIFDENEFCLVILLADDCLIKGVLRRKFFAWPYLPKPRPAQSVFYYRKDSDTYFRLWTLPKAEKMAEIASGLILCEGDRIRYPWCKAFYDGTFHDVIRGQYHLHLPSESEYLDANREKLVKACSEYGLALGTESLDTADIALKKIVDSGKAFTSEDGLDNFRQT